MFGLAVYALATGNPGMFIAPYDADGQMCGFDEPVIGFKNLYFTNINIDHTKGGDNIDFNPLIRSGVCVKTCPTAENVLDATWWTDNCIKNTKENCPTATDAKNHYSGITFLTYCLPTKSTDG